ncbi:MAG: hypothetical protein MN733_11365, partial [Nitrososphaera sp.]|nr:hypothetical protein [Nitrososphaera sp.]
CVLVPLSSLPEPAGDYPQTIEPGMYLLGRDIQPGTYQGQAGADISTSCYWVRLSDVSGDFDAIIANDNAIGQFYIQVSENDYALQTSCALTRTGD